MMIHILLVEDDKSIVTNLTEYLTGEGFCVMSASGQTAALEILSEKQIDLVLLDVSLAEGNGFSACSAIKAQYQMPVIFLTVPAMNSLQLRALIWGLTTTLQNPSVRVN